jgi:hypothetical protein
LPQRVVESEEDAFRRYTAEAHTRFRLVREIAQRDLLARREATPLPLRITRVASELMVLQHLPAANISSGSASAEDGKVPSIDDGIAHLTPRATRELLERLVATDRTDEDRLEACRDLEAALDAHRGFLRYSTTDDTDSKRRRVIEDFEGFTPSEVVRTDPSLGPPAAVRRDRILSDRHPETGRPEDPS